MHGKGCFIPFHLLELQQKLDLAMDLPVRDHRNNMLFVQRERKLDYHYKRRTRDFLLLFFPLVPPSIFYLFIYFLLTVYQICKCRSWGHLTAVVVAAPTEGRKTHVEILSLLPKEHDKRTKEWT